MIPERTAADSRTVAHMAGYFGELKQSATALRDQCGARQRGYFTPSEDEAVRRLLISYWHARNALFELVISYRDDTALPAEARPATFLTALAAAILLVDVARFLREMYDDCPAIVAKLNEAEPHFGIPQDTYDTVQESLTNPRNAWHLYHAVHYFSDHESELRQLAQAEELTPVLAVIDRLGHRIEVSAQTYASTLLRVRAHLAHAVLRSTLLERAFYGLQKLACLLVSDVYTRRGHHACLPPDVADQLRGMLRPGDVFVTRKEYAMTNYFLPGYWPHAALFLGEPAELERLGIREHPQLRPRWARLLTVDAEEPRRVLEALKDGVRIRSLRSPFGSDAIAVLRPRLTAAQVAEAIARGMFHEGKSYDFDFDFTRSDRLVCSEVVYRSYDGVGGSRFELTRRAGRLTLAAEDLLRMALVRNVFETLAVFAPVRSAQLVCGRDADEVLCSTLAHA